MPRQEMDTSAVLKLYRNEPNSHQVRACLDPLAELLLSEFVSPEIISAAYGLVRQGIEPQSEAEKLIAAFEADTTSYTILPFDSSILAEADRLLRRYAASISLRPMDALHLATALVEHRRSPLDAFVTTDKVLVTVARAEGLVVKP